MAFWGPNGLFSRVGIRLKNSFGVNSYSATTFIFHVSFNSDIWYFLSFVAIFCFLISYFLGQGNFQKLFWCLTIKLKTLIFCTSFNYNFCFDLILGSFWAILGVKMTLKNCFRVYLYRRTTFIFSVSFNSDFWFWLNFDGIFYFLGSWRAYLESGYKTVLGSTHVFKQL